MSAVDSARAAQERVRDEDSAQAARNRVQALLPQVAGLLTKSVGPAEIARLHELGPDADLALVEIASDSTRDLGERIAAVRALGRLVTPVGRDYLIRVVVEAPVTPPARAKARSKADEADSSTVHVRQALARAAALALGWMRAVEAIDALAAMLAHPDREIRLDAIAALALLGRRDALAALELRLPQERDAGVKKKLRQVIARLHAQLAPEDRAPPPPPRVQGPGPRPDSPIDSLRDPVRP